MRHDPLAHVLDIVQAADRAIEYVAGLTVDDFQNDSRTQWAVWAQIVIVGEAVRRLPDEWRCRYPAIPWIRIEGMRNRLVHGYDIVQWNKVWAVATAELPELADQLRPLVPER